MTTRMTAGRHRMLRVVAIALLVAVSLLLQPRAHAVTYDTRPGFSWVPDGPVYAILEVGDVIYLGGAFTRLRNPVTGQVVTRSRLAAVDRETGLPTPWNPGADATVRALEAGANGVVFAGGDFLRAGGGPAVRLAAIRPDGSRVPGWTASANATVRDLLQVEDGLIVAGSFSSVDNAARRAVARIRADTGGLVTGFNARVTQGSVLALARSATGSLLLGGSFHGVGGVAQPFLAMVSPSTGAVTGWRPPPSCSDCPVLDLDVSGTRVYGAVGGPGGRVAAWRADANVRLWARTADGDVQAVDVDDDVVYVGGHFGPHFAGQTRHQFAALSVDGQVLGMTMTFTGKDGPGVWAVSASSGALRIGGGFTGISGSSSARYAVLPAR